MLRLPALQRVGPQGALLTGCACRAQKKSFVHKGPVLLGFFVFVVVGSGERALPEKLQKLLDAATCARPFLLLSGYRRLLW